MSHRANLVLVENHNPRIFYSSWQALYVTGILAQGLEFCESFFKEFYEEGWLMDNAYAEGGILIDKNNRKVLIFGGDEISYTPALQRHYCKYIIKIWNDWSVEWCSRGNVDFAEYLGIMEDRILADGCIPNYKKDSEWSFTMEPDRTQDDVITIISEGCIKDYKLDWGLNGIQIPLQKGENLKDIIPAELEIKKWQNEAETTDCVLIDYDTKQLYICWGHDCDDRFDEQIRDIWKGWEVKRQTDGLIFHFDYTSRDKSLVEMTDKQFEEYCKENKLLEYDDED